MPARSHAATGHARRQTEGIDVARTGDRRHSTHLPLGPYLLGAADSADRAVVEAHLAGCAGCLSEAEALSVVVEGLILLYGREPAEVPAVLDTGRRETVAED